MWTRLIGLSAFLFSETRNYVQRVIEDVHVYDARFEVHRNCNVKSGSRVSEFGGSQFRPARGTPNLCFAVTFRLTSPKRTSF